MSATYTSDEMMIVCGSRALDDHSRCFVGIGLPSTAANLARRLHAPDCVLVYESGCIGSKPTRLPLSIGDGELAETADAVVSVPEIFAYWLQAGRIDVGFLSAAQLDRFGNINTTVIGDYTSPSTRLPGAGGAPEIAASAGHVIVIVRQIGAHVRRALRLPHERRLRRRPREPRGVRPARRRPRSGHHRPRHPAPRCRHVRAGVDQPASRHHHRAGGCRDRVAAAGRRRRVGHPRALRARAVDAAGARRGVTIMRFTYEALPGRIVFGAGRRSEVRSEVERLGATRVFLISDGQAKAIAEELAASLDALVAARWDEVVQHVPVELADRARAAVADAGADVVVTVGGGSSTGLAKAIALTTGLPIIAVPTTYAGSEQTTIYGLTGGRHKQTGTRPRRAPEGRDLRPRAHAGPAAGRHRTERVQCPRPLASRRCGSRRRTR